MKPRVRIALVIVIALVSFALMDVSCNLAKKEAPKPTLPDLPLQKDKAITQIVSAKKGGWIFYNDAYQELAVYFPAGSLAKDTEIVLTPIQRLSVGVSDVIDAGFVVEEKGTSKSPVLKKPVALAFKMPDSDPNVIIYKYLTNEGAYTPIKSRLISSRSSNILMTGVKAFSAYGVKKPSAKDKKTVIDDKEQLYKGLLTVESDGAPLLAIAGETIVSRMTMTASCQDAIVRGGIYKGDCSLTWQVSGALPDASESYSLSGPVSMDYLLPSKSTDRPDSLPSNLKVKVESRSQAGGYIELGPDAAALASRFLAPGYPGPVIFRPSADGRTWPFKVFMVPGTDEVLVVTAFGYYMGKFESAKVAK